MQQNAFLCDGGLSPILDVLENDRNFFGIEADAVVAVFVLGLELLQCASNKLGRFFVVRLTLFED